MEMLLGTRRLSVQRLFIVFVAMCLVLYLFYDFISYESKSERRLNILARDRLKNIQSLRDKVYDKLTGTPFVKTEQDTETKYQDTEPKEQVKVAGDEDKDQPSALTSRISTSLDKEYIQDEEAKRDNTEDTKSENKDINERSKDITDTRAGRGRYFTNGTLKGKSMRKKFVAYRKAIEYEGHLRETNTTFTAIVNRARYVSGLLYNPKIVLLSFVCKTCLPFVHSWLCNTKELRLHKHVLLVAKDTETEHTLTNSWPEINVVSLQSSLSASEFEHITANKSTLLLCKFQLINSLLNAGVSLLLFDIKSVWLENPMLNFPKPSQTKVDMLVNAIPNSHINIGFLVLYATEKTQYFWKALYGKLRRTERKWRETHAQEPIVLEKYYEEYLQKMVESRYETITARKLPIYSYTDGMWYMLSDEERGKTQPVVIRNNFAQGNGERIERAKQWNHWFLQHDGSCDVDLVRKTVKM